MEKKKYIYKATLKERGWTDSLINEFLKEPDKLVTNPHYRSGPKSKLYLLERVESLENDDAFKSKLLNKNLKKTKRKEKNKLKKIEAQNKIISIINLRLEKGLINSNTEIIIHCGPTNSGKTYHAIQDLKSSNNGVFLSPLRLLAWEIYYKLNREGVYTSLITGEEKIFVPGSTVNSCTVEMFEPNQEYDCIVLDEAHMIDDENRGWAWLRAILLCKAKRLHIIISQEALNLTKLILDKLNKKYEVKDYTRLVPLKMASKPYSLDQPIDRTIYVAFSRLKVLELKEHFEKLGKKVSIIYGNLPPELRKRQIERFLNGTTQICVATDAIGMGMNLPADRVCFTATTKFDGTSVRALTALEIKQIAGRAGRYQLSEFGEVSALFYNDLDFIKESISKFIISKQYARIAPELEELLQFEDKKLYDKLHKWQTVNTIPDEFKDIIIQTDLENQLTLAKYFSYEIQCKIGIENVFKLIKAPVKNDHSFWLECVKSIINGCNLPLPFCDIAIDKESLIDVEQEVNNCEIYNWIYNCTEFANLCKDIKEVNDIKNYLINQLDQYFLKERKIKKSKKHIPKRS